MFTVPILNSLKINIENLIKILIITIKLQKNLNRKKSLNINLTPHPNLTNTQTSL